MNDIKKLKRLLKDEIRINNSHLLHIDKLLKEFLLLKKILNELDIEEGEGIPYLIQRTQIRVLIDSLTEINESILILLKNNLFNGADPLSRVALEHSINLLYLLNGEENERSKQLLKDYIDTTLKNSERWYNHSKDNGDEMAMEVSLLKVNHLKSIKNSHPSLYDGSCKKWPNAHDRFLKTGHINAYRTLFSMNSDSIHSLSEDTYNFSTIPHYPEQVQELVYKNLKSGNSSLSVYHGIKSIYYYGLVLNQLAKKLDNTDLSKKIATILHNQLTDLIYEHEKKFDDIS